MVSVNRNDEEELNQPLVDSTSTSPSNSVAQGQTDQAKEEDYRGKLDLKSKVWIESKKLWHIVGPSIFSRIATYTMSIITIAFAGHLGDLELASLSIANNVIIGFNFGLLLGMASALETLRGQAFGAKRYHMLGIYMQRSWIVLFLCCFLLLPLYVFATPLLKLLGQTDDVAEQAGLVTLWMIPLHFNFAFLFPVQRFLQSQLRTAVLAWVSLVVLVIHVGISWVFIYWLEFGVVGAAVTLDVSWWLTFFGLFGYTLLGGCPDTWSGFSMEAFSGLWEFVKLSVASGVMLCLENWYYRILIMITGNLKDATLAVDALSICMSINGWEMMIPLAFFAETGVRVANELGAGNGKAARFASIVSVVQSTIIGLFFCALIMMLHHQIALIFTSSTDVLDAVDSLSLLLAITILLNSVQPVLSGVAVGSGWQSKVAYLNLGCYYLVGVPLGVVLGWVFDLGVEGIWGGMIFGGTAVQTVILAIIVMMCNWEKEAEKTTMHVQKWSTPPNTDSES
ncbi:protein DETOXIFICATION 27-like [Rhododendron vialii]|uniref:protein DETOXIFICATION 27-like n=1 Tax=Rhododendron vialii TaxID=182163 RepID=UPI00265DDFDE|nr:protein DETOXIFICATION 27-like [Rhododendron vialii]